MYDAIEMRFNAHVPYTINYGVFVREEMFNGKDIFIWATNVLILANVRLLVSETIRVS